MKNLKMKLAAVAFLIGASFSPAMAGKGGSAGLISDAIRSTSVDAIVAEVERAESLVCGECSTMIVGLTDHKEYRVREVAAWWIAKRPSLAGQLAATFKQDLVNGDATAVRNAADFLGASSTFDSLPQLRQAIKRTNLSVDAKLAIINAVDKLGNLGGNGVLTVAMADADATVRWNAAKAWRDIRGQKDAAPVAALLADSDARVRAEAATVVGGFRFAGAVSVLENLVTTDANPMVRKNAAWALGRIGASSSRAALTTASNDSSSFVRLAAKAALASVR
jgi:HEAT repeat protein